MEYREDRSGRRVFDEQPMRPLLHGCTNCLGGLASKPRGLKTAATEADYASGRRRIVQ